MIFGLQLFISGFTSQFGLRWLGAADQSQQGWSSWILFRHFSITSWILIMHSKILIKTRTVAHSKVVMERVEYVPTCLNGTTFMHLRMKMKYKMITTKQIDYLNDVFTSFTWIVQSHSYLVDVNKDKCLHPSQGHSPMTMEVIWLCHARRKNCRRWKVNRPHLLVCLLLTSCELIHPLSE